MNKERQELHCHECQKYVQFDLDMDLNGNHVIECPNCGHEHCRVVKNGEITSERWDSRNDNVYSPYSIAYSTVSTYDTSNTGSKYTYQAWLNTISSSG